MAEYLVTGGLNGMWHKKKASDIAGGAGRFYMEADFDPTAEKTEMVTCSVTIEDITAAYNSGKTPVIRGRTLVGEGVYSYIDVPLVERLDTSGTVSYTFGQSIDMGSDVIMYIKVKVYSGEGATIYEGSTINLN